MIERIIGEQATKGVKPVNAALVGCGAVANFMYSKEFPGSKLVHTTSFVDVNQRLACGIAAKFGRDETAVATFEQVLADPSTEMVILLTPPRTHAPLAEQALRAGKHVFTEKPFALTFEDGKRLVGLAEESGLRLATAPDIHVGSVIRNARRLIDEGTIGQPVSVIGSFTDEGADRWHPNPEPFFQEGGGPVMDIGPYFFTNLVHLLGPVRTAYARGDITEKVREIQEKDAERRGQRFAVGVPTDVSCVLGMESGARAEFHLSVDLLGGSLEPPFEVRGRDATLALPFVEFYDGPIGEYRKHEVLYTTHPKKDNELNGTRGLGVEEFALAIRKEEPSLVDASTYGLHVLEIMDNVQEMARISMAPTGVIYERVMTTSIPEANR